MYVDVSWIPAAASLCSFFSSPGEGGCTVITSSMVDPTTIILAPGVTFSSLRLLSSFTKPEQGKANVSSSSIVGVSRQGWNVTTKVSYRGGALGYHHCGSGNEAGSGIPPPWVWE